MENDVTFDAKILLRRESGRAIFTRLQKSLFHEEDF